MRHIKLFKESSRDYQIPPYADWMPECIEYMEYLNELIDTTINCHSEIYKFVNIEEDVDLADYEMLEDYDQRVIYNFYKKWESIKKKDIKVYEDIKYLLEDISDNNDCSFRLVSMNYLFMHESKFIFSFAFYEIGADLMHHGLKDFAITSIEESLSNKKGSKIINDIKGNVKRFSFYSANISSVDLKCGVVNLKLEI